jgi:hypothetical protein
MGMMIFRTPEAFDAQAMQDLARSHIVSGPDFMPSPTTIRLQDRLLTAWRENDDTGALHAPWPLPDEGSLHFGTGTLLERNRPYDLALEIARGKVNQVRSQAADWSHHGIQLSADIEATCRAASDAFIAAACERGSVARSQDNSLRAIASAAAAGGKLAQAFAEQAIAQRMQQQPRLNTALGCCIGGRVPSAAETALLSDAFNAVRLQLGWGELCTGPGKVDWERADAIVHWARAQDFVLSAGPLIDFAPGQLPPWTKSQPLDSDTMAALARDYVSQVVRRYRQDIMVWEVAASANWSPLPPLQEDDLVAATALALAAMRQADPKLRLVLNLGKPWGDYLAQGEKQYSPLVFADSFLRSNLNVNAIELEVVVGVQPRGSHARDLIDFSRLLDLYSVLAMPLHITLGCPGAALSMSETLPGSALATEHVGEWSGDRQAAWAERFARLAMAKPYVESITWLQWNDSSPPALPGCGLCQPNGQPRPALAALRNLRKSFLY